MRKRPAIPQKLPFKIDYSSLIYYISQAIYSAGRMDGLFRKLPNKELLVAPLITKEATLSSRIEGTQSSISDVYKYGIGEKTEYEDVKEVFNYKKAIYYGSEELKEKPLSLNLMKELHHILLGGVRGQSRARGEFRKVQNWIGFPGTPIEQAIYIPPEPSKITEYMNNLEKYIRYQEKDLLVQVAIIHYQFETIHPFEDGNGRIGRLLIPLFLYKKGLLSYPILYISEYLERHRDNYYEALNKAREKEGITGWIKFFLVGVKEQCDKNQKVMDQIFKLYEEMKKKIETFKSPYNLKILDLIFEQPIFNRKFLEERMKIDKATIMRITEQFKKLRIIAEVGKRKRDKLYTFNKLLKLFA